MKKVLFSLFLISFAFSGYAGQAELENWEKAFQAAEAQFNSASQYSCVISFQNLIGKITDAQKTQTLSSQESDLLEKSLDYLGQTFFYNNEPEKARETFVRLILQNPNYHLNEDMVSPKIVEFVSQIRKQSLGTVTVISKPVDAIVKLDGKTIGKTDLDQVYASKGEHMLEITKSGYETITKTVRISGEGTTRIHVEMEQVSLVSPGVASMLYEKPALRKNYEDAMASFTRSGDRGELAKSVESIGDQLLEEHNPEAAARFYEEALTAFREVGDKAGIARVLNSVGSAILQKGNQADAAAKLDEALALYRELGDQKGIGRTLLNSGDVLRLQKDLAGARSKYDEALKIFHETGDEPDASFAQAKVKELAGMRQGESTSLLNRGTTLLNQGDLAGAKGNFEEGLAIAREAGDQNAVTIALLNLGYILGQQQSPEAAGRFEEALSISRLNGNKANMPTALLGLGFLLAQRGDHASARDKYQEALQIARETGDKANEALSLYNLAAAIYSLGDAGQADTLFEQSVSIYKEIGQTPRARPW